MGGGLQYLELKQGILLSYCQAIAFYLLLKSEGQAVRDHPVIARLVEIKNLLDKVFCPLYLDYMLYCSVFFILSPFPVVNL